jgi:hypothetical protein
VSGCSTEIPSQPSGSLTYLHPPAVRAKSGGIAVMPRRRLQPPAMSPRGIIASESLSSRRVASGCWRRFRGISSDNGKPCHDHAAAMCRWASGIRSSGRSKSHQLHRPAAVPLTIPTPTARQVVCAHARCLGGEARSFAGRGPRQPASAPGIQGAIRMASLCSHCR